MVRRVVWFVRLLDLNLRTRMFAPLLAVVGHEHDDERIDLQVLKKCDGAGRL